MNIKKIKIALAFIALVGIHTPARVVGKATLTENTKQKESIWNNTHVKKSITAIIGFSVLCLGMYAHHQCKGMSPTEICNATLINIGGTVWSVFKPTIILSSMILGVTAICKNAVTNFVTHLITKASETAEKKLQQLQKEVAQLQTSIQQSITNTGTATQSQIKTSISKLSKDLQTLLTDVKNKGKAVSDTIVEDIKEKLEQVRKDVQTTADQSVKTITNATGEIAYNCTVGAAKNVGNKLIDVPFNLIQGGLGALKNIGWTNEKENFEKSLNESIQGNLKRSIRMTTNQYNQLLEKNIIINNEERTIDNNYFSNAKSLQSCSSEYHRESITTNNLENSFLIVLDQQ